MQDFGSFSIYIEKALTNKLQDNEKTSIMDEPVGDSFRLIDM